MIFPATLTKLTILGANQDKDAIIRTLHEHGLIHITESAPEELTRKDSSMQGADEISQKLIALQYIASKTGVKAADRIEFLPDTAALIQDASTFLDEHYETTRHGSKRIEAQEEEVKELQRKIDLLRAIPFKLKEYDDQTHAVVQSEKKIKLKIPNAKALRVKKGKTHWYLIKYTKKAKKSVEEILGEKKLRKADLSFLQTSKDNYIFEQEERILTLEEEIAQDRQRVVAQLRGKQSRLAFLITALEKAREQKTISNKFTRTDAYFILTGYCEDEAVDKIAQALPDTYITAEQAKNDAPTKLKHGMISKWFAPVTTLFSTPTYGSVDPTRIITLFYPLFFGFMLGDIGYGLLVMMVAGGIALHGNKTAKKAIPLLILSGLGAVLFGILFGSFFGGLIPIQPVIANSFDAALPILIASLAVGLLHLNLAAVLGAVQALRKGEGIKKAVLVAGPLILLETGATLLVFGQHIAGGVVLAGAVALLIANKGAFGIMDITGLFGAWFSYARLLALGLATAGVALAVNTIAGQLLAFGTLGIILWVIIILLGHAFNFVMNLVGCTINAARLHYVEFFSLFFEGGGTPFHAFSINKEE